MPYFLRHYSQFAGKIVVYDDKSDDGTHDILAAHPLVELRELPWTGIDDQQSVDLFRECANEPADWSMCVDVDEFIYRPELMRVLAEIKEHVIRAEGWQMLGSKLPDTDGQLYDEIKEGVRDERYDKAIICRPRCGISWDAGRHYYHGPIARKDSGIKLLHFRYFGYRYAELRASEHGNRLSENNRQRGWGMHVFLGPEHQGLGWFKKMYEQREACL